MRISLGNMPLLPWLRRNNIEWVKLEIRLRREQWRQIYSLSLVFLAAILSSTSTETPISIIFITTSDHNISTAWYKAEKSILIIHSCDLEKTILRKAWRDQPKETIHIENQMSWISRIYWVIKEEKQWSQRNCSTKQRVQNLQEWLLKE